MFIKLKEDIQKKFIQRAMDLAGSQARLSRLLSIPPQSIANYFNGELMPEERFDKIATLLKIKNKTRMIEKKLPNNWRQVIGGKRCVIAKKKKGTFDRDMKHLQNIQSAKLKKWHHDMKKNSPEEYYLLQYSRFKKVGSYKLRTLKGEKVRNSLEKDIADILFRNKVSYEYEPLIRMGDHFFFPDFVIADKIVIECTMWRGFEKAYKLKSKVDILKNRYKVFVVIPKALNNYYKILNNHLILGLDEFAPIAQTFNREIEKGATGRATDC